MERGKRIELSALAWKAKVLPLYEPRIVLLLINCLWSEYKDSNLGPPGPKPGALPDCATLRNWLRDLDSNQGWQRLMRPRW